MDGGPGLAQLTGLIGAIDNGGMALDGGAPVDLSGLLVTYVRGPYDSGVGFTNDAEGFFLQASPNGPAIFVEAMDAGLSPGDFISLRVLAAGRRTATAPRSVTEFSQLVRSSSGNPISGYARDISAVDFTQPALIDLYESRLINVAGIAQGAPVFSFGYRLISLQTAGVPDAGSNAIRFRMQAPAFDLQDFSAGCTMAVSGVPLWRIGATATPTAQTLSETNGSQCPPPNLVSAVPQSSTSLLVSFDRNMAPLSVASFSIDAGVSVSAVTTNTSRQVTLTTTVMGARPYQLICAPSAVDLRNAPLATNAVTFTGLTPPVPGCAPVVISQVYASGGSTTSLLNADFIELHNRTAQPVNITGWSLQYQAAASTIWQTPFALTGSIPGSGFLLIQAGAVVGTGMAFTPDVSGAPPMGAGGGKLALVAGGLPVTTACGMPSGVIVDYVGWGTASCAEGPVPPDAGTISQSLLRLGNGCQDSDNNAADFTFVTPNPRNLTSTPVTCGLCQGGSADGG